MKQFLLVLLLVLTAKAAVAAPLTDANLRDIDFEQKLGAQVSLDLPFRDEQGAPIAFGDCLDGKPTVLVLGYYGCPMLCTLVLNGLISSMQDLKPSVGEKFSVVFVSIDPTESPALAASKKANYVKQYGRRASALGWHFLTGPKKSIATLADEIGYRYAYDPVSKQYAHPSGLVILTPDGKVSRYFFGINFVSRDVDDALNEASVSRIGLRVRQFAYLCFHYSPIRGKYGALIMDVVRVSGLLTLTGLACFIIMASRRPAPKEAPAA